MAQATVQSENETPKGRQLAKIAESAGDAQLAQSDREDILRRVGAARSVLAASRGVVREIGRAVWLLVRARPDSPCRRSKSSTGHSRFGAAAANEDEQIMFARSRMGRRSMIDPHLSRTRRFLPHLARLVRPEHDACDSSVLPALP